MKYKGEGKVYFGIGIEDCPARMNYKEIFFYWFKLIRRNPEGGMLQRGRDYKGFIFRRSFRIPDLTIEI